MKASIHISGQIGGNFKLLSKLNNGTKRNGAFNSFYVYFESITEAKKYMRNAWRELKKEREQPSWHDGLSRDATFLSYDASKAILSRHYNKNYNNESI